MGNFSLILDPKSRKRNCFSCGEKTAVSYVNKETGDFLPDKYCKCDRANSCGYNLNPYIDGFHKTPGNIPIDNNGFPFPRREALETRNPTNKQKGPEEKINFIPKEILKASLAGYDKNAFVSYLNFLFGVDKTTRLVAKYYIGSSTECWRKETGYWDQATVFWFIDECGRVRAGQVKLFENTGHTLKFIDQAGKKWACTDNICSPIKRKFLKETKTMPAWLTEYMAGKKFTCLFGAHLLKQEPTKIVGLVESPKTAIICSAYFPDLVWLATGALDYFTEDRCQALRGRRVIVFPCKLPLKLGQAKV